MQKPTLDQHLNGPGPKRILALDGGGVRGILTLGFLERIEQILRARHGNDPDFRLSDYFDMVAGTSTGAIIAAGLAMGFSVDKLKTLYQGLASSVFNKPFWRLGLLESKFPTAPLQEALNKEFGDVLLGSNKLLTGLMVMTKRLDTGSPWVVHNHPRGRYFDPKPPSTAFPNKDFLVRQVVRASTAAPHYFEPERINVAAAVAGAFVDGGVSPHNNPALQAFMLATMKGYGWRWDTGADQLLLASVGTGSAETRLSTDDLMDTPAAALALRALSSLMDDCTALVQTTLQWNSRCPTRWKIDREIGDLSGESMTGRELLHYLRYNIVFDSGWLKENLGITLDMKVLTSLSAMDDPKNLDLLLSLGTTGGQRQVQDAHFPASFDRSMGAAGGQ